MRLNLVPVDFVVEGIATLSKDEAAKGKTIALADPNPLSTEEICNAIFVRFQNVNTGAGSDVGVSTEIPEPSTMLLLGTALIGLGGVVRRRMKGTE